MTRGTITLLFLLATACSSSPAMRGFLDPETSVTVSYTDTPMVFYLDRSGRAAFSRDFVNIGPIQVNRVGRYRYFLWFGIWNTVASNNDLSRRDGFERVTIYADGKPVVLDVAGWTPSAVGATRPVYVKPVSSAAEAYYEVTTDQLRLLARAAEIRIQTSGYRSACYEMWDSNASASRGFRQFLDAVSY